MNLRKIRKAHALLAATVMALPAFCSAASSTWDGSTTSGFGYFSEGDNWTPVGVPANNGTADLYFASTNTHGYTPTLNISYNIDSLNFNSGALAFNINGNGNTLTIGAGGITDNATNAEQFTGPLVQSASETWNIASGSFTLDGPLTSSSSSSLLTTSGAGTLVLAALGSSSSIPAISIGGAATQITSGTLKLTQTASNPFNVSAGSLTISGGATVDASADTSSYELIDGSTGPSVTVSGSGTQLKLGSISCVGYTGSDTGSLTVQQNASVTGGSSITCGTFLTSSGTLSIASGGSLTDSAVVLGDSAGTTGTATVSGSGSTLTASFEIYIGGATSTGGTGSLTLASGGNATTPITEFFSNNATVFINAGTLNTGALTDLNGDSYGAITLAIDPAGGYDLNINGSSGTNFYYGSISGAGSISKSGGSTQFLEGTNTFSGSVIVVGGTLNMASGAASYYDVEGGTLGVDFANLGSSVIYADSGGTVTYSGPTLSGGFLEGPGTHNLAAVSTIAGTTIENGTTITPANNAALRAVTSAGTIVNPASSILFWYGGSNAGGTLNVSGTTAITEWTSSGIVNIAAGAVIYDEYNTNMILLGGSRTYVGTSSSPGGSISLSGGETIELNGGLLVNYGTVSGGTVDVNFGGLATGTGSYSTVNVNPGGTYSPGTYTLTTVLPQSSTSYAAIQPAASGATTTGTSISVNATANITVNGTDSLTLTSPLITNNNAVAKQGTGTVTLPAFSTTSSLTVSAGTIKLASSSGVLQAGGLSIAAGATLDLTNDDMIIHNGNLGTVTTAGSITNEIAQGRGTNGLWTGPGITSSAAAATPSRTALAVELNSNGTPTGTLFSTFEGQPVTNTDVLVKFTFVGDADLSGSISSADYMLIDNGFNSQSGPHPLTGWRNGDFNYDGLINGDDYTLIDNAYNTQGSVSFANTSAGPSEMIATDTAQITLSAAVPEPTSLSILGIISFSLVGRSSRQRLRR